MKISKLIATWSLIQTLTIETYRGREVVFQTDMQNDLVKISKLIATWSLIQTLTVAKGKHIEDAKLCFKRTCKIT